MSDDLIVIGSGLAAWSTVRELRKLGSTRPIIMITQERGDFYAKPSLSNAFAQGKTPEQLINTPAQEMADKLKVTLLPYTEVTAIDRSKKIVSLRPCQAAPHKTHGQLEREQLLPDFQLPYDKLVLATGAAPLKIKVPGDAAQHLLAINNIADFENFHQRLQAKAPQETHVLILGAGLIGSEFACDLAQQGYTVTALDLAAYPIAALLPPAAGEQLRNALQAQGITFHFGTTLTHLARTEDGELHADLSNGQHLRVDAVLSAISLRPSLGLALQAGLATQRGIVVNHHLQTSDEHIYALGDNAQYDSAQQRPLPYVMPIMNAARVLAKDLAEERAEPLTFPIMPIIIKTPALPIVMVPSLAPGTWKESEPSVWHYLADDGQTILGFILTGEQTRQRAQQLKHLSP